MKPTIKIFGYLLAMLLIFNISACSKEEFIQPVDDSKNLERSHHFETWEDQVEKLNKKMMKFHNFQVSQAQGYTVLASPYVPHMGYHYLNPNLMNGEFNLLEPEVLVYHEDENGNMVFGAVEYVVPIQDLNNPPPHPEGFIGDEDHWHINAEISAWTLHAWVGVANPDGVFAAFNPAVPAAPTN